MARFSSSSLIFFSLASFLMRVIAVAADVANGGAVVFQNSLEMLHHIAAAFLGHRRNRHANELSVREGIETEIGRLDGLFDLLEDEGS